MHTRLARLISRTLEFTIVACLSIMAVLVFGNVVLRYAFNSGIAVSEELSRLLFVWLIFLGAVLASRQHAHIGFDSLVRSLPRGLRKAVIVAMGLLMLAACGMFVLGGWQQTVINLDNTYPVLGISYGWLYGVAIVFGVGNGISILLNLWDTVSESRNDEDLAMTQALNERIEDELQQVATGAREGKQ